MIAAESYQSMQIFTRTKSWLQTHQSMLVFLVICTVAAFALRTVNIDHTARFTQDESSDILRMSRYWKERKITLVGPISNDQSKVFSSLSYYMVMPFAAAGNFTPLSPVYGTAFWGVLTAVLLLLIAREIKTDRWLFATVLAVAWGPLLTTSRWMWNPHFVPFWIALAVFAYLYKKMPLRFLVIGAAAGLAFHHHYVSVFATAPFVGLIALQLVRQKDWRNAFILGAAFSVTFVPFALFDLRHPPGLFFTRYLTAGETPNIEHTLTAGQAVEHLFRNLRVMFEMMTSHTLWLTLPLALTTTVLVLLDWFKKRAHLFWIVPIITLSIGSVVLDFFFNRYAYAIIPFFFVWLLAKRTSISAVVQWLLCGLLVLGTLLNLPSELTKTRVVPDIYSLTHVDRILREVLVTENPKNPNIAVLASKDTDLIGIKYRDLLSMYGVRLRLENEIDASENMFIISTSDEARVRADAAQPMQLFGDKQLKATYTIPDSDWKVYWFHY